MSSQRHRLGTAPIRDQSRPPVPRSCRLSCLLLTSALALCALPTAIGGSHGNAANSSSLTIVSKPTQRPKHLRVRVTNGAVPLIVKLTGAAKIPHKVRSNKTSTVQLQPRRFRLASGETRKIRLKFRSHRASLKRINGLQRRFSVARKRSKVIVKVRAIGAKSRLTAGDRKAIKLKRAKHHGTNSPVSDNDVGVPVNDDNLDGDSDESPGQPSLAKLTAVTSQSITMGLVAPPVIEASGLSASHVNSDTVWTHNDSGGAASLYALGADGSLRATLPLVNAVNVDWEDIARGPGPDADYLYVADIGDNGSSRATIRIYRVAEPDLDGVPAGGLLLPAHADSVSITYPDGAHDAEAMVVDPVSGDIFIVTKRDAKSLVYRAPEPAFEGESVVLHYHSELDYNFVLAADACPSGTTVLVKRTANIDAYYSPDGVGAAFNETPSPRLYSPEPQGEAVAADVNCTGYLTLSEGWYQPLIRYLP